MKIEIVDKNVLETLEKTNSITWKMYYKKRLKVLFKMFIIGLLLLIPAIIIDGGYDKFSSLGNVTYFNLHIFLSIGIIYFLFLFVNIVKIAAGKKVFLKNGKEDALRQTYGSNERIITIDEESIKYNTISLKMEMNWVLFSKFEIYKDTLFLYTSSIIISIQKEQILETHFLELLNFVKIRLKEIK